MKPPPFEYDVPESVEAALELLDRHGPDAKVLAGGQSLVPLLNFRLARPERLIDINRLSELSEIRVREGRIHVGALARQAELERSELVRSQCPLLHRAVRFVAHAQIRNRGTVGGSIAHADPAAELPAALAALDGAVIVKSRRGQRELGWRELFISHFTTALDPDELLVDVVVPASPAGTRTGFAEYTRRHGDFALGGAAVTISLDSGGVCTQASLALLAAAPTPVRIGASEELLHGRRIDAGAAREAAAMAAEGINPTGDIHGSSAYRRRLIEAMVRRAILDALDSTSAEP